MRYIIIYAVLNPTPKGVGYDLNVHFVYFRNPKLSAPFGVGDSNWGTLKRFIRMRDEMSRQRQRTIVR